MVKHRRGVENTPDPQARRRRPDHVRGDQRIGGMSFHSWLTRLPQALAATGGPSTTRSGESIRHSASRSSCKASKKASVDSAP